MFGKRKCCCRNRTNVPGYFLIALGSGLFLAYVIPRYLLITLLGLVLVASGVCCIIKK
ncbi:MAG: hypothetical protein IJN96_01920 [Clostridia bacterium]|nr:hypothetical protein [Clostridia bacterium]